VRSSGTVGILRSSRLLVWGLVVLGMPALAAVTTLSAQTLPDPGATAALPGNVTSVDRTLNIVIVNTIDGAEHAYHFTKDLVVHGGKGAGLDALEGLHQGRTVVVHYRVQGERESAEEIDLIGEEGLKVTEGAITHINRGRRELTIRFANGTSETFQLTERAAGYGKDIAQDGTDASRVIIYYADASGRKVAHYFRRISRPGHPRPAGARPAQGRYAG
jgi:hypothetical protein